MTRLFAITLFLFLASCLVACQPSASEQQNSNEQGGPQTTDETSGASHPCDNCGMPWEDYPKWHSKIVTDGNSEAWFCSSRCMFIHLNEQKVPRNGLQAEVTDYYTLEPIDGTSAFFVTGSDVSGPMGPGFVAFSTEEAASEFMADHNGQQVLKFNEITWQVIKNALKLPD